MHSFHVYFAQRLEERLLRHRIVVVYDEKRDFAPFFDEELQSVGSGHGELPRVFICERLTFLAKYDGSFFGLRAAVEPLFAAEKDELDPLVIYVPGVAHDRHGSVLMELEKAGTTYEPGLTQLAGIVLKKYFTAGQVEEALRPAKVTYQDIAALVGQAGPVTVSVLRALFGNTDGEELLGLWLTNARNDEAIVTKGAVNELRTLVESRLGLTLAEEGFTVAGARDRTLRYVLVNEFRSDLAGPPPPSAAMVPPVPSPAQLGRVRTLAARLRAQEEGTYEALADGIEKDLALAKADLDPANLGSIDTFRFEERRLLEFAERLVAERKFDQALQLVAERGSSYWVDRIGTRQAQWEACRLTAELGRAINHARAAVDAKGLDARAWVEGYAATDGGWHQVDALHRRLEEWVGKIDEEPSEAALALVRKEHEELLRRMAEGFFKAFKAANWAIPGVLHQTRIYPELVQKDGGTTAYVLVDAMRYEMGVQLMRQLAGVAEDLAIRPAVCGLPSITPVGMAALLPGASSGMSLVESKGALAARIETTVMATATDRLRFLGAKVPGFKDLTLDKVGRSVSKLRKAIEGKQLVVVRSQEIDSLGEQGNDSLARLAMNLVLDNLAHAVKTLAAAGVERFVITADHGHQFARRKEEDMRMESPGGQEVDLHRRCWIGRGGATPAGTVRLTGGDLGYGPDSDLEFVFPTGLGVFRAGGGLSFHHGGLTLQEVVIPVVTLRIPPRPEEAPPEKGVKLLAVPEKITNRIIVVRVHVPPGLFDADVAMRVVLLAKGDVVGQAGMVTGAVLDRDTGILRVKPGAEVSVGLQLKREDIPSVRVTVLDPATDAVLAQSTEIPVNLGM